MEANRPCEVSRLLRSHLHNARVDQVTPSHLTLVRGNPRGTAPPTHVHVQREDGQATRSTRLEAGGHVQTRPPLASSVQELCGSDHLPLRPCTFPCVEGHTFLPRNPGNIMTICSQSTKKLQSQGDKKRVSSGTISDSHPWRNNNTFKQEKNLNENQIGQGGGNQNRPLGEGLGCSWDKRAPGFPSRQMELWRPPHFSGVSED